VYCNLAGATAHSLSELSNIRDGRNLFLAYLSSGELHDIICFICTSLCTTVIIIIIIIIIVNVMVDVIRP